MIAGYIGGSDKLDEMLARFARAYADQVESDHQRLVDAVAPGRPAGGDPHERRSCRCRRRRCIDFWTERHLCTLTTLRADGSPARGAGRRHRSTPMPGLLRVIASRGSAKVRHVAAPAPGAGWRSARSTAPGGARSRAGP